VRVDEGSNGKEELRVDYWFFILVVENDGKKEFHFVLVVWHFEAERVSAFSMNEKR
jgi:hypothetical protein